MTKRPELEFVREVFPFTHPNYLHEAILAREP